MKEGMTDNFLDQLNEVQREAVTYVSGPSLVIAGAGSGKTRVLTYKIACLLASGMAPWSILALTFTNKAANEMKARIGKLVGDVTARRLNMGTFHSVFSHILRVEASNIGFNQNFTIYDETDSRNLLKNIIKEMSLDDKKYSAATVHGKISMAKNRLQSPSQYANDAEQVLNDVRNNMPEIKRVYAAYCERCRQANAMDFDDLLVNTYILFKEHENIRQKYAEKYGYVLVDEYQDTNFAQKQILWQLTKERQKVCVVGDDAQSIYGFRGAEIKNIIEFQNEYTDVRIFKLERNYRSTQRIVQAANSLISHNRYQLKKEVYSDNAEGDKLTLIETGDNKEEAKCVCELIKRYKREDGCGYGDFAILYRTNSQSRSFEEVLQSNGIPNKVYGGLGFYQRKEIKDIIAYFRLVVNSDDEEAFRRVVNYPARGIGDKSLGVVLETAHAHGVSPWNVISNPQLYPLKLGKVALSKIDRFHLLIQSFKDRSATDNVYTLGESIIKESGVEAALKSDLSVEGIARIENLDELLSSMYKFVDDQTNDGNGEYVYLSDYLQSVSLLSDTDDDSEDEDADSVTMMAIHRAKGLEFKTVFVVGLEENLFPSLMSGDTPANIEEERRLLYVAITRAEKHCVLTDAERRLRYGKREFHSPSRFLRDIDPSLITRRTYGSYGDGASFGGFAYGGFSRSSSRMQNGNPVATQFMADPQPKVTRPVVRERPINPFGESTLQKLKADGANLRKISSAVSNGGRASVDLGTSGGSGIEFNGVREGSVIEHQRFGIGKVTRMEGSGENTKATVEFRDSTKQLLLKFARFKVIK